jgi:hypothetical protein
MPTHSPEIVNIKQSEPEIAKAVAAVCCELVPGWKALPHASIKVCTRQCPSHSSLVALCR